MGYSLEINIITGAFVVYSCGSSTETSQRRDEQVRSGYDTRANAHRDFRETWESLPSPSERGLVGLTLPQQSGIEMAHTIAMTIAKNKMVSRRYLLSRETEDREKGGGSLSILIVLTEEWEISSMKAT